MNFGEVEDHLIPKIDFSLPDDGLQTFKILKHGKRAKSPAFYVGCAKWDRKEWLNMIYPPKTKRANFLDEYVKSFNSVELNAAFYRIPTIEQVRKWRLKVEQNAQGQFLFFPKFSGVITHMKRLKAAEGATDLYLSNFSEFGKYLGPYFIQLADKFSPKSYEVLENYLKYLPRDIKVFVELRHEQWFSDSVIRKDLFDMLSNLQKGVVITDTSGRRDLVHMELTIPEIFIRFVGNGEKHQASDFARIDEWTARIKKWLDQGLENVYFFLHQHDEKDTPILANYTIQQFNKYLGAHVAEVKFLGGGKDITKQGDLF